MRLNIKMIETIEVLRMMCWALKKTSGEPEDTKGAPKTTRRSLKKPKCTTGALLKIRRAHGSEARAGATTGTRAGEAAIGTIGTRAGGSGAAAEANVAGAKTGLGAMLRDLELVKRERADLELELGLELEL